MLCAMQIPTGVSTTYVIAIFASLLIPELSTKCIDINGTLWVGFSEILVYTCPSNLRRIHAKLGKECK